MNARIFVFLALALVPLCSATFDPSVICSLVVNGTKINDPRVCNGWIECTAGQPVAGTCGAGLFYDRESEKCVDSDSIQCLSSDPCASVLNGFAADPYSCSSYYYCLDGKGTKGYCPTGMNFSAGTETCIRMYPCKLNMDPDSYCNILPDGVFIKDSSNCNGWQMCWDGEVISGTCPGTFYFSASSASCDYPQNVACDISVPPLIAEKGVCAQAGDFVSDKVSCNGYYYCHELADGQMALEHAVCSDGRFFLAADGGACVPRTNVACPYDRCVGLGNTTIQLASESDDGCRGFAICQDGVSIGTGTCPAEEYFDELTQRCTTAVISYPACQTQVVAHTANNDDTTGTSTSDSPRQATSTEAA
ncbi:peritrophin-48 [Drosophila guanche]|uniref:Blast:Peritrophin-48 n=1 Tax=Drosophila guanche TaxID=7266 RepID=A0A3B0KEI2_DROGU|nr:peritrophin-48 [Drosophila guanche]SPP84709.1 blast:Peritrophin-48 [Drosophila guanche]